MKRRTSTAHSYPLNDNDVPHDQDPLIVLATMAAKEIDFSPTCGTPGITPACGTPGTTLTSLSVRYSIFERHFTNQPALMILLMYQKAARLR